MQQLTRAETSLLAAETQSNLGHHSVYLELEPQADGSTLTFTEVRERFANNIHLVPALRRRICTVPLSLDRPWWLEDPHFDLDYHLRHLAVPGSADPEALDQLIARLHERPLDHDRPLWEAYLIDHPDGASGVFIKAHHAVLRQGDDLLAPLTRERQADADHPTRWQPDLLPSDSDLLLKAWWTTLREPCRIAERTLATTERLPVVGGAASFLSGLSQSRRSHPVEQAVIDRPMVRTSFNRPVGPHRRVARFSIPTDRLRQIRGAAEVRFHDVVLAVVSGALRHWMIVNDEMQHESLVAMTPFMVNDDEKFRAGLIPLATHLHEPAGRLDEISHAMSLVSAELDARPVAEIASDGPDWTSLMSTAARMVMTTGAFNRMLPSFNVCVVSAPCGPSAEIEGHRVAHQHAIGPIIDGIGLSVTALSHDGIVDMTLNAARDLLPDLDDLAAQIEREVDLLFEAVGAADHQLELAD